MSTTPQRESTWTVGDVARSAGITVRTLHHYDRIGLLVPAVRTAAGYRGYTRADLDRLQRILAYRELGLGLDEVAGLLDDPAADAVDVLRRQHRAVLARMERLREVAAVLERTMEAHEMGINLTPGELLEVFGEQDPAQHEAEVQERWGDTDAYRESRRRSASYTKDDWLRIKADQEAPTARLAELLAAGEPADGEAATDAAEAARVAIDTWFYDLSHAMHICLAQMYLADPRFTAYYEGQAPGLARYVHDAILANAARHGVLPD
jgi:DNA-binding transcriptional MerR regulator